jgi:AcrR family transcriptional regulator
VRERLITAASELLSEQGFETSVEEITERAGFSRGAFYSNFDSKDELLLEAVRRRTQHRIDELERALSDSVDLERLTAALGARARRRGARQEFEQHMQFLFHALARSELRSSLAQFEQSRQRSFADVAIRLIPQLRAQPQVAEQLGIVLSALEHGLAIQTYLNGKPAPLDLDGIINSLLSALEPSAKRGRTNPAR